MNDLLVNSEITKTTWINCNKTGKEKKIMNDNINTNESCKQIAMVMTK